MSFDFATGVYTDKRSCRCFDSNEIFVLSRGRKQLVLSAETEVHCFNLSPKKLRFMFCNVRGVESVTMNRTKGFGCGHRMAFVHVTNSITSYFYGIHSTRAKESLYSSSL
jgi:hypothetical protein